MPERRQFDLSAESYMALGQRVAVVETNQKTLAEALKETVGELKKITLTLAERRGAEKLTLFVGGGLLTVAGGLIEHFSHAGTVISTVIK